MVVGLSLGLRLGEALRLWWEDVGFDQGVLRVRRQLLRPAAKGAPLTVGPGPVKSARTLALPAPLAKLLGSTGPAGGRAPGRRRRVTDDRLVFATSAGTPIDHRSTMYQSVSGRG